MFCARLSFVRSAVNHNIFSTARCSSSRNSLRGITHSIHSPSQHFERVGCYLQLWWYFCTLHCHSYAAMYTVKMYENTRPDLYLHIWVLSCAICPMSKLYEYFSTMGRVWRCYQAVIRSQLTFSGNSAYVFVHSFLLLYFYNIVICIFVLLCCCVLLHDILFVFLCYQPVIRS